VAADRSRVIKAAFGFEAFGEGEPLLRRFGGKPFGFESLRETPARFVAGRVQFQNPAVERDVFRFAVAGAPEVGQGDKARDGFRRLAKVHDPAARRSRVSSIPGEADHIFEKRRASYILFREYEFRRPQFQFRRLAFEALGFEQGALCGAGNSPRTGSRSRDGRRISARPVYLAVFERLGDLSDCS
jgi:hypothetical protein